MKTYEQQLEEAYKKVKVVEKASERFEIPKVSGTVEGKNTVITNIKQIAEYLRRPMEQIAKFLQRQLAANGKIENDRLILNTKLTSQKVNDKLAVYTKEFVQCNECNKPDTELVSEKGIKYKHCLACGAKSPIRNIL
ncbi:MAG TPA: translation initiation factor IF-2 subunit beta [Candidatus Nanoarchaeia archaeon]|nr:translation initiation factor IF-2 subunit beta [Candidatus Nanoarchaeia archaeon]